jgi:hypothetical protein
VRCVSFLQPGTVIECIECRRGAREGAADARAAAHRGGGAAVRCGSGVLGLRSRLAVPSLPSASQAVCCGLARATLSVNST